MRTPVAIAMISCALVGSFVRSGHAEDAQAARKLLCVIEKGGGLVPTGSFPRSPRNIQIADLYEGGPVTVEEKAVALS